MAGNTDGASAGVKRGRGRPPKKEKIVEDLAEERENVNSMNNECINNHDDHDEPAVRKRPKRAAACTNFKENSHRFSDKSSYVVEMKKNIVESDEIGAIQLTRLGPEDVRPCRKLVDFVLHDEYANPQPFEMSEVSNILITALIIPLDDDLKNVKERGVMCEGFGRIESWSISGYDEGSPEIWLSTVTADYKCVKPASKYKRLFDLFQNKACICVEVYQKLARSVGGNPNLSLEQLLAAVVRTKGASKDLFSKDIVISFGDFIYNQLVGLDETSKNNDVHFATLPTLLALREECLSRTEYRRLPPTVSGGALKINEGGSPTENENAKPARVLQEEGDWKSMRQQRGRRAATSRKNVYIKINEAEIANDYPLPAYYKPEVQEMNESITSECDGRISYNMLPRRILSNWALYNSDSRLISLELLPMKPCAVEEDVAVFGSGNMKEDDGSGYILETDPGQSSSDTSNNMDIEGVPVYLTTVKEWMIEFGSSMVFISIRTDVAWYRLGKPTKQYAGWYEPVLKTAKLAIAIITLLKEQSRVSKLSFTDVIKKVSDFDKRHPAYISSNMASVERYVVVHGQIILQQFAEYPDEHVKKCTFITSLSSRMEELHHTKLIMKKKVALLEEANLNPSAAVEPTIKSTRKVMHATTTRLINQIWGDYYTNFFPEDAKTGDANESKEESEDQEENEEDESDYLSTLVQEEATLKPPHSPNKFQKSKSTHKEVAWEGEPSGTMSSGEVLYKKALVWGYAIAAGGAVKMDTGEDSAGEPIILLVEFMFEKVDGTKMMHGRVLKRGYDTILRNAAKEREVFLTNACMDIGLEDVKEPVVVEIRSRSWGHIYRKKYADADKADKAKAEERKKKGLPMEFFCKVIYCPERGGFFSLPHDRLGLGDGSCDSCKQRALKGDEFKLNSSDGFIYNKIEYNVHDFLYIRPQFFCEGKEEHRGTFKASRNVGLRPYVVCHLLGIEASIKTKQATPQSTMLKVRKFYRPEDISATKAYSSDIREVYYSEEISFVPVEMVEGKCEFRKRSDLPKLALPSVFDHVFFCEYSYDPLKGSLNQLPANVKLVSTKNGTSSLAKKKGKEMCIDYMPEVSELQEHKVLQENCLSTLDIFAGCGGLSEGLQQSGASITKWAIEYEQPAGEAFSDNHPEALMFIDNCNVILRAIMEKCGDVDDCISTSEAAELAAAFSEDKWKRLPMPGEVDFINGGPPCQGFSGMNRFNQGTWSKVQCEMILAFLSFADYFRPKYFLLENVRNFVSFSKGHTFRLTLASLLAMGYQVRFGILEAGAYGVSQSRKRAFIWAASPEEILPEWPEPMHVFSTPELKIAMPGDVNYAAVRSTAAGAPYRSITVRDTIGDLPPVENGASKPTIEYGSEPQSWFQKEIRGDMLVLNDHISKGMNELNLKRCQHIPKRPGADWRDLPDKKIKLAKGQLVELIPWCLPNTAERHNQWKGLYGRLNWEGNFPTSITDPQPMGKVGMCFHPEQDRIITVRECARSQGFPDRYLFSGTLQNKHRQIGNAVPPPLAFALGRQLKRAAFGEKL